MPHRQPPNRLPNQLRWRRFLYLHGPQRQRDGRLWRGDGRRRAASGSNTRGLRLGVSVYDDDVFKRIHSLSFGLIWKGEQRCGYFSLSLVADLS